MVTLREARQRASIVNACIEFIRDHGEYRVTLQEWPQFRASTREYCLNMLKQTSLD